MHHRIWQLLCVLGLLLFTSSLSAQIQDTALVIIGDAELNLDCDTLIVNGTAAAGIPFVRVQMVLYENPLVLLVDEIVPVEGGAYARTDIQFRRLRNAALMLTVTGWDGARYVSHMGPDGMRPLGCYDESGIYQLRVPGVRVMRTSRQQWTATATEMVDTCTGVLEASDTSFPGTALEGLEIPASFPVTLSLAENGLIFRLDWNRRRFKVSDDGGTWIAFYEDNRNQFYYMFDLTFTSQTTFTGSFSIFPYGDECFWGFDWQGVRNAK
jgi:hypothetical protein